LKRADWKEKAARQAIRAREKAELDRLALELSHARERKRQRVKHARALCKRARLQLRDRLQERRRLERERLKREAIAAKHAERATCQARRAVAKRSGGADVAEAAAALKVARTAQKAARKAAARRVKLDVPRSARIHESDDSARRDIPAELQGVWDRVKGRFKSGGRRSRAEAFLEWAEENPHEVVELQSDTADREVARLVREHEAQSKKVRMRKTKAEIARELAAIPF